MEGQVKIHQKKQNMKGYNNGDIDHEFEFQVKRSQPTLVVPEKEAPKGLYFLSNLDQNKIRLNPKGRPIAMDDPNDRLFLLTSLEENIGMVLSIVFFFKSSERGNETMAKVLRESLSKILSYYYPFAGRLRVSSEEKLVVECTGEGAVFVEAEANCEVEDLGDPKNPNAATLGMLVYNFAVEEPRCILDVPLLMAQVTKFRCGGFVLGLSLSHAIVDGVSAARFVNAWGETARGLPLKEKPFLDRTLLKSRNPPIVNFKHHEFDSMPPPQEQQEELQAKTFVLDTNKLKKIKSKALEDNNLKGCTTFEALSAFIWRARTLAMRSTEDHDNHKPSKLIFPVDGRSRFNPPLPKGYFGNAIVLASCTTREADLVKKPLSYAVGLVKKAIKGVTDGFMRSHIDCYELTRARPALSSILLITTWARLSFYETDFGRGKPSYTGPAGFPAKEVVMLLSDGDDRKSIDMMVALPGYALNKFETLVNDV